MCYYFLQEVAHLPGKGLNQSIYLKQEVADPPATAPWAVSCLQQPAPQPSSGETAGGQPAVLLLPQPQPHTQPADTFNVAACWLPEQSGTTHNSSQQQWEFLSM